MAVDAAAAAAVTTGDAVPVPRSSRLVIAPIVVGLILRFVWMVFTVGAPRTGDELFYFESAQGLANGRGYVGLGGEVTAFWAPGYSFVLGALFLVVERTPLPENLEWAAAVLNLALAAVLIWLVFQLGVIVQDERLGRAAAWLVALWPNHIFFTSIVLSEGVFNVVILAALLVLLRGGSQGPPRAGRVAAAGALLGYAALVRPVGMLVLVAVPIVWWWWTRRTAEVLRAALVMGLVAMAVIAPWTIRNAVRFEHFVPISTTTGTALCVGNNPSATGGFGFFDECSFPVGREPGNEAEVDGANRDEALDWIVDNPTEQLRLVPARLHRLFENDHDGLLLAMRNGFDPSTTTDRTLRLVANSYYALFATAAAIGAVVLARRSMAGAVLTAAAAALLVAVLPFFAVVRYHQPMFVLGAVPAAAVMLGIVGWARSTRAEPAVVGRGSGDPIAMTVVSRRRRVLHVLEIAVVVAALAILAAGYIRSRPSFSRTIVATSFETDVVDLGSEPEWLAVGGTWTAEGGELRMSPDDDAAPGFLVTGVDADATRLRLAISRSGRNGGAVMRYVDEANYWSLLYRPAFAAWQLARVVDGVEEPIDATGPVSLSTELPIEIEVAWDSEAIVVRVGATELRVIDSTHGGSDRGGIMQAAPADPELRWGAVDMAEVASVGAVDLDEVERR